MSVNSVLSDASCFPSFPNVSEWSVVLGHLKQNGTNPSEVRLSVTNITVSNLIGSNVAMLRLSSSPSLSNFIQPICLGVGRTFSVGTTCYAARWSSGQGGEEQTLQEFRTSVMNCGLSLSGRICTGAFSLEQGVYGGPLMCKLNGSWFQAVVLANTNSSTNTTKTRVSVQVFDKLSRYKSFLSSTLGTFLSPVMTAQTAAPDPTAAPAPLSIANTDRSLRSHVVLYQSIFLFLLLWG